MKNNSTPSICSPPSHCSQKTADVSSSISRRPKGFRSKWTWNFSLEFDMTKPQFLGLFLLVLLPACAALQGDQDREITLYILLSGLHLDVREVYHFRAIPEHGD